VCGNNATTRWTDALGIPQEDHRVYLTPTSKKFRDRPSLVAPLPGKSAPAERPALEKRALVEATLAACRKRVPRLPLADQDKARALLPADWPKEPLAQWVRLLANFPVAGKSRILGLHAAQEKGELGRKLPAQVAWIAARHDRAWYALGQARKRLAALGVAEKDIWALDGSWDGFKPSEQAAFALARKLTVTPHLVSDDDIALVRKHFPDRQVAELVYQVCNAAFFNRLTEAARLRLEE
jgi:alkylhydroperoxidase family enzyme